MGECNRPLISTLPVGLCPGGTIVAKNSVGNLPLAEHVQYWGHLAHRGHKHSDLHTHTHKKKTLFPDFISFFGSDRGVMSFFCDCPLTIIAEGAGQTTGQDT